MTVTQAITWHSGKTPVPANMHGQKLAVWIYRPGMPELSTRFGRYITGKGWVIENTDNATVHWYARLEPIKEKP